MKTRKITLIVIGMICVFGGASQAIAGNNKLTGSWIAIVTPVGLPAEFVFLSLPTFDKDGTVIISAQGDSAARQLIPGVSDPVLQSSSHGVWDKIGSRTYAVTTVHVLYYTDGSLAATFKVRSIFEVSQSGEEFDSLSSVGQMFDPDGNLLLTLEATVHGERIHVELPE
ncbi:hypothetical protein L0244_23025 [bacterium]|nr:hypothetical protein [bacterium]MCI0615868.1 hypothetical protein [bacterium]